MTGQIIDGKLFAKKIRSEVATKVEKFIQRGGQKPCLATVLVGDDAASQVYVSSKQKACQEVGIDSLANELPATATQDEIETLVRDLNHDPRVNGILVQLPLPEGIDEEQVLNAISIKKDVDGFHPLNVGKLAQIEQEPLFVPCTPAGVMYLLKQYVKNLEGANAVVIGRSNVVGMPVALLLIRANATVTICHSKTKDLPKIVRRADVLVTAIGKPEMVRGDWVKSGAVVIDVGINRVNDPTKKKGYRLVGDVAFDEVVKKAKAISPVPGGVGPMTIAMLLKNTLRAAKCAEK